MEHLTHRQIQQSDAKEVHFPYGSGNAEAIALLAIPAGLRRDNDRLSTRCANCEPDV